MKTQISVSPTVWMCVVVEKCWVSSLLFLRHHWANCKGADVFYGMVYWNWSLQTAVFGLVKVLFMHVCGKVREIICSISCTQLLRHPIAYVHNSHTGSTHPTPNPLFVCAVNGPDLSRQCGGHIYLLEFPMADHHLTVTDAFHPRHLINFPSLMQQRGKTSQTTQFPIIPNVFQHMVPISTVWVCVTPCECFYFPYICSSDTKLFVHALSSIFLAPPSSHALSISRLHLCPHAHIFDAWI